MKKMYIRIFLFCVCIFFSYTFVNATTSSFDKYITTVSQKLSLGYTSPNTRDIFSQYCSTLLGSDQDTSFTRNNFLYDARQSVFVYVLCNHFGEGNGSFFAQRPLYFAQTNDYFKHLGLVDMAESNQFDYCKPMSNNCNIAKILPKLFDSIIGDYVLMKQSFVYGLSPYANGIPSNEISSGIVSFSQKHFAMNICDGNYPSTCKAIQSYSKKSINLLRDMQLFSYSGVTNSSIAIPFTTPNDIFYSGIYGNKGADFVGFVNLVYNELFFYRLFMTHYLISLQRHTSLLTKSDYYKNYDTIFKRLSNQYTWSKSAISLSLRMLGDVYMAFPFHIGFLLYQERLDGFGKSLSAIAPPIYTLHDKLRNVQQPD